MRVRQSAIGSCVLTLALSVSLPVAAQAPTQPAPAETLDPEARAQALKSEGDAAMQELRFADALQRYQEAHALSGSPALLYNQGRAHEKMGQFPEALELLRAFRERAPAALRERVPNLEALLADLESRTTLVTIRTTPPGASVRLGDRLLGKTPIVDRRVNASRSAELSLELAEHHPITRSVALPGGRRVELELPLVPRDGRGLLVIESPVPGARIEVDGRVVGQVPTELRLAPGEHRVTLRAEGYEDNTVELVLATGETKRVRIEPGESPLYERWWFWTIGGGLLAGAGATALGVALTTEGPADVGTIAPGQAAVAAGPRRGGGPSEPASRAPAVRGLGPVSLLTLRF